MASKRQTTMGEAAPGEILVDATAAAANGNEPQGAQGDGASTHGELPPLDVLDHLASGGDGAAGEEFPIGGGDGYQDAGPAFLPFDQWSGMLGGILGMTGQVAGLETLARSPGLPTFGPAARELYDIACANESLHWLVAPDNPTLKAVVVVGAWAVPVSVGCYHEIRAKRARPVPPADAEAAPEAPAANDNQGEA